MGALSKITDYMLVEVMTSERGDTAVARRLGLHAVSVGKIRRGQMHRARVRALGLHHHWRELTHRAMHTKQFVFNVLADKGTPSEVAKRHGVRAAWVLRVRHGCYRPDWRDEYYAGLQAKKAEAQKNKLMARAWV